MRASHVVPKFVGKWLKSTSATGFLTRAERPEERAQDLPTLPLLCPECEERFSKLETYFANEIFFPFHDKKIQSFEYDERLQSFAMSLSWRTLKESCDDMKQKEPGLSSFVDKAELDWRNFLLGKRLEIEPYENHFLFLDPVTSGAVPPKFEWYVLRSVDATLAGNRDRVFAFTKLPRMIFYSSINPTKVEGWKGTRLDVRGRISSPQTVEDDGFWEFIASRAAIIEGVLFDPSSQIVEKRALRAMIKDPWRFLESDSFEAMIAETDRLRLEKPMPENVKELIKVIAGALEDRTKTKRENRQDVIRSRNIANALSNLPEGESAELDGKILSTIIDSRGNNRDSLTRVRAKNIWVTFMVNPHSAQYEQRSRVEAEVDRLRAERGPTRVSIAVFSMLPAEDGVYFETGFALTERVFSGLKAADALFPGKYSG